MHVEFNRMFWYSYNSGTVNYVKHLLEVWGSLGKWTWCVLWKDRMKEHKKWKDFTSGIISKDENYYSQQSIKKKKTTKN